MTQITKQKQNLIRDAWKDYFSFSKRVRRGLLVLSALIVTEILILFYLNFLPSNSEPVDGEKFKDEVDAFYARTGTYSPGAEEKHNAVYPPKRQFPSGRPAEPEKPELFFFNPNNFPDSGWKRLGFSDKQIRSIKNYEAKGGTYRSKEDVKKMYAIRENEFNRIAPYIVIPEQQPAGKQSYSNGRFHFRTVDIGTADTAELKSLPMIGAYLAQKIFNYREWLGGFYSVYQLKEVRGLTDSAFHVILPLLLLKDSSNLRKINLNTADFEVLNRHPYIDKSLAGIITSYRRQHGSFTSLEDLRKVALVDEELYRKIAPYLKVE